MSTMNDMIPVSDSRWSGSRAHRRTTRSAAERLVLLVGLIVLMLLATSGRSFASSQRDFGSPQDAVDALMQAVQGQDAAALVAVLGPARDWLFTGDRIADRAMAKRFAESYRAKHAVIVDGDRARLMIGEDEYPFAFPIVRTGARWRFDTDAGKEQLLERRIGQNELSAIQTLRAIVDAQLEYASADRNGDGVVEYARRFHSTAGKRDGLYWKVKDGEPPSPLGPLLARASTEGYRKSEQGTPVPYHGYLFRLLDGKGKPGAPDAVDYIVRGRMIGGFAVLAYPAKYGITGIMTFVVDHEGVVHEVDLGPQTATTGAAMKRMELGAGWARTATPK